ncbi:MAG: hypothetical protein IJI87_07555 [Mogibacterium sp.]|nr:hypothetical protein [Mogibacterium sp.]
MKILNIEHEMLHESDRLTITIDYKDRMQLIDKLNALGNIEPEAEYDIEVKKHRQRRSLDANAYLWVLADKIAEKAEITATDVYRKAIHDVGTFQYVAVHQDKSADVQRMWEGFGVGWIAEEEPCSIPGSVNLKLYAGSSAYDTKQMSRLIDYIVDEAKGLEIETMTPDELARIKSEWRAQ